MRLRDRIALVTGGSRSIGRGIAIGFAREGAHLTINYRSHSEEAHSAVEEIRSLGRRAIAVQADTSNSQQVNQMVDRVIEEFGRIDILVNNAGIIRRTPFLDIAEDEWDLIIDVNLKGYFLVGQAVARQMVKQNSGVVINISSAGQQVAIPNVTHYNVAKGGVAQLTRQMALELVDHGIRVNAICPGMIETDLNRARLSQEGVRARTLAAMPLKIIGTPEDLVGTAVYLASEDSRLVTGSFVFVDQGETMI